MKYQYIVIRSVFSVFYLSLSSVYKTVIILAGFVWSFLSDMTFHCYLHITWEPEFPYQAPDVYLPTTTSCHSHQCLTSIKILPLFIPCNNMKQV